MARNEQFEALANGVAGSLLASGGTTRTLTTAEVLALPHIDTATVQALINASLAKLGENVVARRAAVHESANGVVGSYVHNFGSYGAIVEARAKDGSAIDASKVPAIQELCSKIAQHIVANDPGELANNGLQALGKQHFVFDGSMTINQVTVKASKQIGLPIQIASYLRWKCGVGA